MGLNEDLIAFNGITDWMEWDLAMLIVHGIRVMVNARVWTVG